MAYCMELFGENIFLNSCGGGGDKMGIRLKKCGSSKFHVDQYTIMVCIQLSICVLKTNYEVYN